MPDKDFHVDLSVGPCWVMVEGFSGLAVDSKAIIVPPVGVATKEYLDSLVHEVTHQTLPHLSEAEVVRVAGDITMVLWKRGYRLPRRTKKLKS